MLAKKYKLKKSDFSFLLKNGKKIRENWFGIIWVKSQTSNNGFGVIIPLAIVKKAVQRNVLKRKIFGIAEKYIPNSADKKIKILLRVFKKPNQDETTKGLQKLEEILKELLNSAKS